MSLSETLNRWFSTWYLGRWGGVAISIHWSWLCLVITFMFASPIVLTYILGVLGFVFLHEYGRCFVMQKLGYTPISILLYPVCGITRGNGVADIFVILSGTMVNVLLLPVLYLASLVLDHNDCFSAASYLYKLELINITILVLNLLPIYPLDGGQILCRIMSNWLSALRAKEFSAGVTVGMSVVVAIYGVMSGHILLTAIALFVYYAASQES